MLEPILFCFAPDVTHATWQALELYDMYVRTGALPSAGGLLDQPMWLMRAFAIIDAITPKPEAAGGNRKH